MAETDLEGGEEEDALFQSLRGVDIGMKPHPGPIFLIVVLALNSVSLDDLWKLLPEEKEVKSIKVTGDPSSELARQLLVDNGKLSRTRKLITQIAQVCQELHAIIKGRSIKATQLTTPNQPSNDHKDKEP